MKRFPLYLPDEAIEELDVRVHGKNLSAEELAAGIVLDALARGDSNFGLRFAGDHGLSRYFGATLNRKYTPSFE